MIRCTTTALVVSALSLRAVVAQASFSDDFEGPSIKSFWTMHDNVSGTGNPPQFGAATLSNEAAHSGTQSLKVVSNGGGHTLVYVDHLFSSGQKGTFTIWFYDTMAPGAYEYAYLFNTSTQRFAYVGTRDYDPGCYSVQWYSYLTNISEGPAAPCGAFRQVVTANAQRTAGWHKFQIVVGAQSIIWSIDGADMYTAIGDYTFDVVGLALQTNGWVGNAAYYDDFSFVPLSTSTPPAGSPGVVSLSPVNGSGYTGTFTSVFTQSGGNHYLGYTLFLPTPNIVLYTAKGSCLIEYNKYSNGVRLINDAGDGWLGPVSGVPIAPGAPTLTNTQCSIDVSKVVANVSGPTMTVTMPVTFYSALGPVIGTFLQAEDNKGVWTGMTQFGNWTLPGAPQTRPGPSVVSVSASATSGTQATYTITASHNAGTAAISMMHLLAGASIVGSPVCQIVFFPAGNALNMVNDAGSGLVSPTNLSIGQPGNLSNSRCSINAALVSRTQTANSLSVVLPLTYNVGTFSGQKTVWVNAFDNAGLLSHWVAGANINVQ